MDTDFTTWIILMVVGAVFFVLPTLLYFCWKKYRKRCPRDQQPNPVFNRSYIRNSFRRASLYLFNTNPQDLRMADAIFQVISTPSNARRMLPPHIQLPLSHLQNSPLLIHRTPSNLLVPPSHVSSFTSPSPVNSHRSHSPSSFHTSTTYNSTNSPPPIPPRPRQRTDTFPCAKPHFHSIKSKPSTTHQLMRGGNSDNETVTVVKKIRYVTKKKHDQIDKITTFPSQATNRKDSSLDRTHPKLSFNRSNTDLRLYPHLSARSETRSGLEGDEGRAEREAFARANRNGNNLHPYMCSPFPNHPGRGVNDHNSLPPSPLPLPPAQSPYVVATLLSNSLCISQPYLTSQQRN